MGDSKVVTTATFHASSHDGISLTFLELDALGPVFETFVVGSFINIRTSIFGTKVAHAIPGGLIGDFFQIVETIVGRKPQFTWIVRRNGEKVLARAIWVVVTPNFPTIVIQNIAWRRFSGIFI